MYEKTDFEFAPMEGITYWPFRRAHAECFPGNITYYTPFIAANSTHSFKTREKKETDPANNAGLSVVPQILTNDAGAFLWAAGKIAEKGYREINFNLGCPSPTVVTHGKGAGFLADPVRLDRFFDDVFGKISPDIRISVKTRIGMESESEADELIRIFNRYPFSKLIVHPRLRTDYYKGNPRINVFEIFYENVSHPLVYNGNLFTVSEVKDFMNLFPDVRGLMIGRGLLMNPSLVRELEGGEAFTKKELKEYHDRLLDEWLLDIPDFSGVIGKMKELWFYFGPCFMNAEKAMKKIRKSRRESEYRAAVEALFEECRLLPEEERVWRP